MNNKKIAVIIHKTNATNCSETVKSLEQLAVPVGFSLDVIPVESRDKYLAYNYAALRHADAKYKIYISDSVVVRRTDILSRIIELFESDEKIGVIGVSGAIELSTHGICLQSTKRCGKVQQDVVSNVDWGNVNDVCREVDAVDSWFMATQYDLTWRDDLFKDDYFGDTAQCIEFKRNGYKCVVIHQDEPCLSVKATNFNIDEASRTKFLEEYSADIYPLVSVIIPTFNRPHYFKLALESVLNQTYRNFEIVVSDDGTNDETEQLIQPYLAQYPFIKYFRNRGFTANDNWNFLRRYNNPKAEYVNWLMDDDLFMTQKLEIMVEAYRNNPDVSIVASTRYFIDAENKVTGQAGPITQETGKVNGESVGKLLLNGNYIGEPTTILIRKKFLRDGDLCWSEDETGFFPLVDVSTFLMLLSKGNMFYIVNPLSALRSHDNRGSNQINMELLWVIFRAKFIKHAWDNKIFLRNEMDIKLAIIYWIRVHAMPNLEKYLLKGYRGVEIGIIERITVSMAQALTNGYHIELPSLENLY